MEKRKNKKKASITDVPKDVAWNCFKGSGLLSYYLLYKKLDDE